MKILVVVMGFLIIAGVVTIVVTIVSRLSEKAQKADANAAGKSAPAAALTPFGDVSHALPAGARIVSVSADSGRLYVHYHAPGGRAAVLVLNGANGARLGELGFGLAK